MSVDDNKRLVSRAVTEIINGGDLEAVDELYAPELAPAARDWVAPFRTAFPDVRMETVALVGEGDTVVGHFRCSGTQTGPWMGRPGTGRAFHDVREVYWFTVRDGRIVDWWGLEDDDDRRRQLRAAGPSGSPPVTPARGVHDDGDPGQADQRAGQVVAVGPEPVQDHPQARLPATRTPPYAAEAMRPDPIHSHPRRSRRSTPGQPKRPEM